MLRYAFLIWPILLATTVMAQQPSVVLEINARVLEPGEKINAKLVCANIGVPGVPKGTTSNGLKLAIQSNPSRFDRMSIINGRTSSTSTYTYNIELTALKEGTYTVGPLTVTANGKRYVSNSVKIVVRQAQVASIPRGDRLVWAEIAVDRESVYQWETYRATLTFGMRKVEIDGRIYQLDLLREVLDQAGSQLSDFGNGKVTRSEQRLRDSEGQVHRYEVFRAEKVFRGEVPGEATIGPVFLKTNYPTRLRRGFFNSWRAAATRRVTARAEAVTVLIKAPPLAGRPSDFTGAVGHYVLSVSAAPTQVEQGQPVTLTIGIAGSPLEGVAGPDLSKQPVLVSRFEYVKDELVGDLEGEQRVFRRAIFPKNIGEQTIPSISWSYFDTHKEAYVTLRADPIPLVVDPPSQTTNSTVLAPRVRSSSNQSSLTALTGGLVPNYDDADSVLATTPLTLTPVTVGTLALPPLAWAMVALITRHRKRLTSDKGFARRRQARRSASQAIDRASRTTEPSAALQELAQALTGFLSDWLNLPPGEVTPGDVHQRLCEIKLDQQVLEDIVQFLKRCDETKYAPGVWSQDASTDYAAKIMQWIKAIEGASRR